MRRVLILLEHKMYNRYQPLLRLIKEYFTALSYETEEFCAGDGADQEACRIKLLETKCDYLCTLDLPCLGLTTLLGYPLYNLLPARQIHIVLDTKKLPSCRKMDLALNLFVFVPDTGKHYEEEYPRIPNLAVYPAFDFKSAQAEERNRTTVRTILDRVRSECGEA